MKTLTPHAQPKPPYFHNHLQFPHNNFPLNITNSPATMVPTYKVTNTFKKQMEDIDCALKQFDIPGEKITSTTHCQVTPFPK